MADRRRRRACRRARVPGHGPRRRARRRAQRRRPLRRRRLHRPSTRPARRLEAARPRRSRPKVTSCGSATSASSTGTIVSGPARRQGRHVVGHRRAGAIDDAAIAKLCAEIAALRADGHETVVVVVGRGRRRRCRARPGGPPDRRAHAAGARRRRAAAG